ncbi:hypothetical protein MMC22_002572 [Lobaria immixta]|nr:hypothetical protein [Lobaria immixta]
MQTPTEQFGVGFAPVAKTTILLSEVTSDDEPVAGVGFDYHLGLVPDFSPGIPETALNMAMFAENRGTPNSIRSSVHFDVTLHPRHASTLSCLLIRIVNGEKARVIGPEGVLEFKGCVRPRSFN